VAAQSYGRSGECLRQMRCNPSPAKVRLNALPVRLRARLGASIRVVEELEGLRVLVSGVESTTTASHVRD